MKRAMHTIRYALKSLPLFDASSVSQIVTVHLRPIHSDIRGVQSNIIFVDHTHPENDDSLIGDRADGDAKTSKQNAHEVQMVLKIVRYFLQQGYKSEDMVVLTPYLGQLHQLRDALKRDYDLVLNNLDALDLARAGLFYLAPPVPKGKSGRIHLATIDHYQGEESDIVIVSLTRSNKSNAIGFMDSPERLNALLSRARCGLILIGNSQTFLHSRKGGALWKQFFALLEQDQYVHQGFPVKCERHPEQTVRLECPSDFDEHCPNGGCTYPCGFMLACGHPCPIKCHPHWPSALHDPHDASQCNQPRSVLCPAGHKMTWVCRQARPSYCSTCDEEDERLDEIIRMRREAQKRCKEAEAECRRWAELEARTQTLRVVEERRNPQEEERNLCLRKDEKKEDQSRERQEEGESHEEAAGRQPDQESRKRIESQCGGEMRAAELRQEEEQRAAADKGRKKLMAERRRVDARVAPVARAQQFDAKDPDGNPSKKAVSQDPHKEKP